MLFSRFVEIMKFKRRIQNGSCSEIVKSYLAHMTIQYGAVIEPFHTLRVKWGTSKTTTTPLRPKRMGAGGAALIALSNIQFVFISFSLFVLSLFYQIHSSSFQSII